MMKLIVGLGNPGEKYKNNRHNVGYTVIDALELKLGGNKWSVSKKLHSLLYNHDNSLILSKPETFMNSSGEAVSSLSKYYKIKRANIWVIHDDLDILLGQYKIQKGTGPKLHYGIRSIEEKLRTKDFWRVRVGVDNRSQANRTLGEQYVLEDFEKEELVIRDRVIREVVDEILKRVIL